MAQSAPTKGNLIAARHSRELALTGFDLMDKKRNILIRELMAMTSRAKEIRGQIDSIFAAAYDSLTTAEISLTASTEAIVSVQIDDSLSMRYRSVMGVELSSVVSAPKEKEQMPFGTMRKRKAACLLLFTLMKISMIRTQIPTLNPLASRTSIRFRRIARSSPCLSSGRAAM